MKYIIYFLLILPFYGISQTPNLVPNPEFELGNYTAGATPIAWYSGDDQFHSKPDRFEADIDDWFCAKPVGASKDSPDWIPGSYPDEDGACPTHDSYYVRSASHRESIMTEMVGGYKLIKGRSYRFRIKVRFPRSSGGSFQLVFSAKPNGLRVNTSKKWTAASFYLDPSCEWRNIESYFTVPTDDNKDYEEMKYLVLQYNDGVEAPGADLIIHYDDVELVEAEKCEDYKLIQDWQYWDEHRIVQANIKLSAGAHVYQDEDPLSDYTEAPVIVRSNAMVIYRAPTIVLDNAVFGSETFIVEDGAYFETETGTCLEDPCPPLPVYSPPTDLALCSPQTLGTELPQTTGIFYAWTPSEYFSAPWSRVTDFIPPSGNGCIDSKLTIWSICGPTQEYSFPVKYNDEAPQVSIDNVQVSPSKISFQANFENVQEYTIVVTNVSSGQIIYEDAVSVGCGPNLVYKTFILKACDFDMCGDKEIKIIADNACFDQVEASFIAVSPTPVSPALNISSVNSDDFAFSFDVAVSANTEFVTIELWNEGLTVLECTKTYRSCDIAPGQNLIHWDNSLCQSGCLSVCGNHKIKIKYKNICSAQVLEEMLYWNKTSNTIQVSDWPNVMTPNGDGINDDLCVNVTGADWWEIWVEDRWGLIRHHEDGCVTSNPVCMWINPTSMPEDVYFYTIKFTNNCGDPDNPEIVQNTQFIHIFTGFGFKSGDADSTNTGEENTDISVIDRSQRFEGIQIYPNPVDDYLYIGSSEKIQQSKIMDLNGKVIITSGISNKINCSKLVTGAYIIEVKTSTQIEKLKFIKL